MSYGGWTYHMTPELILATAEFTTLHPDEIREKDIAEAVDRAAEDEGNWNGTEDTMRFLAVARANRNDSAEI